MEEIEETNRRKIIKASAVEKHAKLIERLSIRSSSTTNTDIDSSHSHASTAEFIKNFNIHKKHIDSQLALCKSTYDLHSKNNPPSNFDHVSTSITELEDLVAQNSYTLPAYEVRAALKSISELRQNFDSLLSEFIPKRKFTFVRKNTKINAAESANEAEIMKSDNLILPNRDSPGLRNKQNASLSADLKSEAREFTLSDLDNCEVRLIGSLKSLFINGIRNSRIYVGPVLGSILIEEIEASVLILASHQIRIHHAKATDFYLRLRSRPIIEDCKNLRFAPYCLSYQGINEDLRDANLHEDTGNWAHIDDFGWLRSTQSPNWSILSEKERIGVVIIGD